MFPKLEHLVFWRWLRPVRGAADRKIKPNQIHHTHRSKFMLQYHRYQCRQTVVRCRRQVQVEQSGNTFCCFGLGHSSSCRHNCRTDSSLQSAVCCADFAPRDREFRPVSVALQCLRRCITAIAIGVLAGLVAAPDYENM